MSRLVIVFAVAFATALAGSTGATAMRAKKVAQVVHDSLQKTAADSLKKVAAAQSAHHAADSSAARADTSAVVATAEHPPVPTEVQPHGVAPTAASATSAASATHGEPPKGAKPVSTPGATPGATTSAKPTPTTAVKAELLPSGIIGDRIGKIFASMASKDAVKVLMQLDDQDVAVILARLSDKKAAEVLALMPADRAATISRRGISHAGSLAKATP